MNSIERFATDCVAPSQRLDFWNELCQQTYAGLVVDSHTDSFNASMLRWAVGDLLMIRPHSPSATVQRWRDGGTPNDDRIILHLQHRGHTRNTQWNREAHLKPGDFALCCSGSHYRLDLDQDNVMLVAEMSRSKLIQRMPDLDRVISRTISGTTPGARLVHDFLLSLWQQGDQTSADPEWQEGVVNVFLDLLALSLKGVDHPASPTGNTHQIHKRMTALIEAQLTDPDLRTNTIADELGVSVRTVQHAFAAMGTTPSAYITDRRMERAADRLLAEPGQHVTNIAFDLGFNDSAYFTRCFRQKFGISPTMFRLGKGVTHPDIVAELQH